MNQHLFAKIRQLIVANLANRLAIGKIGALIWRILASHLNDSELIRDPLHEYFCI